jgi:hypothetical protein
MGKQDRVIAQKAKDKQHTKKPKAVKTNLKRVRLGRRIYWNYGGNFI